MQLKISNSREVESGNKTSVENDLLTQKKRNQNRRKIEKKKQYGKEIF